MPANFDKDFMIMMIAVLVIVTIAFERGSEHLEEMVKESGNEIQTELLHKMFKELTILGFVAFSATMLLQAEILPLTHDQHLNYEFSHILMFSTAIVYSVEIFQISRMLCGLMKVFDGYDLLKPEDILQNQLRKYGPRATPEATKKPGASWREMLDLRKFGPKEVMQIVQNAFSEHEQIAIFKALKFHFLGFNGMLGTRFSVSTYIEESTEKHIGEMIDIDVAAWVFLLVLLTVLYIASFFNVPIIGHPPSASGTAMFGVWGTCLLLAEVVLLIVSRRNLSRMMEDGHHIRTSEEGDRWEEYFEHQAIVEAELAALSLSVSSKKEADKVNSEMTRAGEMYRDEVIEIEATNKKRLQRLEMWFQFTLLCQSMLQALIVLMLARNCFIFFDMIGGLVVLFFICLPTALMSRAVTPRVLSSLALAYAVGVKNTEVLEKMMADATAEGDYAAAGQVLQLAMTEKLSDEDLDNETIVRKKVKDLLQLGELKWRYRVVEEGQSPRDEAIKVLDEAQDYIISHIYRKLDREGVYKSHNDQEAWKRGEEPWASELSESCQGLGLARLIFNGNDRSEDDKIHFLLVEALTLRQALKDKIKIADTQNALGSLAQKQKNFVEAEARYKEGLRTREELSLSTEKEAKEKEQMLAQSYTSLGNMFIDATNPNPNYEQALKDLLLAKECYVRGFHPKHPKVAWAVEAQASVHKRMKNFREAQACIEEAIAIRSALQEKGDGKALFSNELNKAAAEQSEIVKQRKSIKGKYMKLNLEMSKGRKLDKLSNRSLDGEQSRSNSERSAKVSAADLMFAASARKSPLYVVNTGAESTQNASCRSSPGDAHGGSEVAQVEKGAEPQMRRAQSRFMRSASSAAVDPSMGHLAAAPLPPPTVPPSVPRPSPEFIKRKARQQAAAAVGDALTRQNSNQVEIAAMKQEDRMINTNKDRPHHRRSLTPASKLKASEQSTSTKPQ